ncbi:LLM class F420-dependent oxidoreductase [Pseudonocardia sulfidoxydans NBRC 16205]|uniref:LLM class F420-dependent oxidoreductase n=1 Tax=Pseudonocardia sulfidoxydans NBRC 16205 TaxID=1223511 RepID=A0A511DPW9_9PSEU|nr:LLM class flavin-dependent oxidoreductase [Pseudonocardia sulfidoxydans]GEL25098.1 LLM class F420-dependent oxidoreductase [Pseudonocardia sulfidoxydans NBRC 16205]
MELRIMIDAGRGADYDAELTLAQAAESLGFSGYFRSDHHLPRGGRAAVPTDAWTTLAGLARETTTIRLGTLVSDATFRPPALLAVQVAQVDRMSGGRVELGIGPGGDPREHRAFGTTLPEDRDARFEEQLGILHALWQRPAGSAHSAAGRYFELVDFPVPSTVQHQIPVILSGLDSPRATVLTADFAHEFNAPPMSTAAARAQIEEVRRFADYRPDLVYSVTVDACVGTTGSDVARRAAAAGDDLTRLTETGVVGTPAQVVEALGHYAEAGATRVYLRLGDASDLDHLELIASAVAPQLP